MVLTTTLLILTAAIVLPELEFKFNLMKENDSFRFKILTKLRSVVFNHEGARGNMKFGS